MHTLSLWEVKPIIVRLSFSLPKGHCCFLSYIELSFRSDNKFTSSSQSLGSIYFFLLYLAKWLDFGSQCNTFLASYSYCVAYLHAVEPWFTRFSLHHPIAFFASLSLRTSQHLSKINFPSKVPFLSDQGLTNIILNN